MNRMLIIHPHWPPSNTVGVHRVRLIANELHHFGWKASVLTIDERDIEDDLSPELEKLVSPTVEVIKVRASPIKYMFGKRLYGDIGLRGFRALRNRARKLLKERTYDFIWFSIPSWYTPLMGPYLSKKLGVPYGVDYRDPWVYKLTNQQKGLNRASLTIALAHFLEPIAIKKAALLSGVSQGYLDGVISRNNTACKKVTFQMGFCKEDHLVNIPDFKPPFQKGKQSFVYAGAYSHNWAPLFRLFLQGLERLQRKQPVNHLEFIFIGTGNTELQSLTSIASELGISELVTEIPERIPFLHVQQCLRQANGAIVIGSTEPHYSASKLFQCLLTSKKLFAFFNSDSEAHYILQECTADRFYVPYNSAISTHDLILNIEDRVADFINPQAIWNPDLKPLAKHNSRANTEVFVKAVENVITNLG